MFEILGKSFNDEKEYLDFIVENEDYIINSKKSVMKKADGFVNAPLLQSNTISRKSVEQQSEEKDVIDARLIINTTNVLDSHKDVHVDGLWNKSLRESGNKILHLQEHKMSFKNVIARGDDLNVYAKKFRWRDLGFNMPGTTEALVFDSKIRKSRNPEMFKEYSEGNVTEHSVGMYYVKLVTCINDEDYPVQKENWDKYSELIANKEALESTNVFWAVLEAKAIEGSAVLFGSNSFTPTHSAKSNDIDKETKAILEWLKE